MKNFLFEGDNLGFTVCEENDLNYLLMLDANPKIMHFFPTGPRSLNEIKINLKKYISEYKEKGYTTFLVFDVKNGEFVGRAGFGELDNGEIEVGYLVLEKLWGQGYATRILKILLEWAKHHIEIDKIIAFAPLEHIASQRVMQKAGMKYFRAGMMKGVKCAIYEYKLR